MTKPDKKEEEKVEKNKDECDVAFKFAFVGAGQGGSRIAHAFHRLGYRKLSAINTAQQDLNTIDLEHKLCIGTGGAGKDPSKAKSDFEERKKLKLILTDINVPEKMSVIVRTAGIGKTKKEISKEEAEKILKSAQDHSHEHKHIDSHEELKTKKTISTENADKPKKTKTLSKKPRKTKKVSKK